MLTLPTIHGPPAAPFSGIECLSINKTKNDRAPEDSRRLPSPIGGASLALAEQLLDRVLT